MTTDLIVSGLFDVPYIKSAANIKCIDNAQAKAFWEKSETTPFRTKQGIYVFSMRAGKGFQPIYVRKSTKGFKSEFFTSHKLHHHGQALANGEKGNPVMFFIAPPGKQKKVAAKTIGEIEDLMIQFAVAKNPSLRNKVGTKAADWTIKGVVRGGKGKKSKAVASYTTMMGITKTIAA